MEHERERTPRSGYSASLERSPHQATGGGRERWAGTPPEDAAASAALVDAGWEWSVDGEYARALALFTEALKLEGGAGGPARIGMADQLCRLGRREEAHEVLAELREELEAAAEPDGGVYAEAAGLLEEHGAFAEALEWCDAGLARCAELGGAAVEAPAGGLSLRERLLMTRRAARRELGLPPDAQDEEARLVEEKGLAALGPPARERSAGRFVLGRRAVERVILYWPRTEFTVAVERWPSQPWASDVPLPGGPAGGVAGVYAGAAARATPTGDGDGAAATTEPGGGGTPADGGTADVPAADHELHRRRVQHEAERLRSAHVPEVVLVSGSVAEYEEFAARTGRDAAVAETFAAYAVWRHHEHPELSVRWPPPRNAPCWCGSSDAYKACCGVPADG